MKSLAQRLKEKEAKEAKARLKRSDRVKSFSVKMPWCGCPSIVTEGDSLYIKKRAKRVVDLIQSRASWQFFQEMKNCIIEMEAAIIPAAPVTPPTIPSQDQSPTGAEPVATTPPAQRIESPGVSVREVDITTAEVDITTSAESRESILGPVPDLPELTEEDFEESLFEVRTNNDG